MNIVCSLHSFRSPFISFTNSLYFLTYYILVYILLDSHLSIPPFFFFLAMLNGLAFSILVSVCSLQAYRNIVKFYVYPLSCNFDELIISSRSFFVDFLRFFQSHLFFFFSPLLLLELQGYEFYSLIGP